MRVLLTGMTSMQCGGPSKQQICSISELYQRALQRAGHLVERRVPSFDEDLTGYDQVFVGLGNVQSFSGRNTYPALNLIGRCPPEKLVVYLDDWQFHQLVMSYHSVLNKHGRLVKDTFRWRRLYEEAVTRLDSLEEVVVRVRDYPLPALLVTKFEWGDEAWFKKYFTADRWCFVDPSVYTPWQAVHRLPTDERERVWVSGALAGNEDSTWLPDTAMEMSWPLEQYGGSKDSTKFPKVKEWALVHRYSQVWGTVCKPYRHAGSGWWRVRYEHAWRARAITLAHPDEAGVLGDVWKLTPKQVEDMPSAELDELARAQGEAYAKWRWSENRFVDTLDAFVRGV